MLEHIDTQARTLEHIETNARTLNIYTDTSTRT